MKTQIINYAKTLGFDLVAILPVQGLNENHKSSFYDWINSDFAGEMQYMKKEPEKRIDLRKKFPDAKTIIVVGINYFNESRELRIQSREETGKIAKYAYGRDYHKVFEKKLKLLGNFIKKFVISDQPALANSDRWSVVNNLKSKLSVDYGPILERAYAEKTGLGYIGRNTCLITEEFGSWVFLGELVTNIELRAESRELRKKSIHGLSHESSNSALSSKLSKLSCGSCTQCISVCPTGALIAPYKLDARKCISYLTIENKGSIPEEFRSQIGDWLYGCDLCQEVCPHNVRAKTTKEPDLKKKILGDTQLLKDILSIRTDEEFRQRFAGSPVIRIKRKGLLRNACVVAGNLKNKSLLPLLEECLKDSEPLVREHAEWGIFQIENEK